MTNCPIHPSAADPNCGLCHGTGVWKERTCPCVEIGQMLGRNCEKHPSTPLVCYCPKCRGEAGGRKRAESHTHKELSKWGKKGGRPRKKALNVGP